MSMYRQLWLAIITSMLTAFKMKLAVNSPDKKLLMTPIKTPSMVTAETSKMK